MSTFVRCENCRRHVRAEDTVCPFCGVAVPVGAPLPGARGRLGRAAVFAFGTALAGCASSPLYGLPPEDAGPALNEDAGTDDEVDAGTADAGSTEPDGGIVPPYGAPAVVSPLV